MGLHRHCQQTEGYLAVLTRSTPILWKVEIHFVGGMSGAQIREANSRSAVMTLRTAFLGLVGVDPFGYSKGEPFVSPCCGSAAGVVFGAEDDGGVACAVFIGGEEVVVKTSPAGGMDVSCAIEVSISVDVDADAASEKDSVADDPSTSIMLD